MKIMRIILFLQQDDQFNILRIYSSLLLVFWIKLMLTLVAQEADSSSNDDDNKKRRAKSSSKDGSGSVNHD
jgi:hypothetical protein